MVGLRQGPAVHPQRPIPAHERRPQGSLARPPAALSMSHTANCPRPTFLFCICPCGSISSLCTYICGPTLASCTHLYRGLRGLDCLCLRLLPCVGGGCYEALLPLQLLHIPAQGGELGVLGGQLGGQGVLGKRGRSMDLSVMMIYRLSSATEGPRPGRCTVIL